MKRFACYLVFVASAVLLIVVMFALAKSLCGADKPTYENSGTNPSDTQDDPDYVPNIWSNQAAANSAYKQGKPRITFIGGVGCGPCKLAIKILERVVVQRYRGQVACVHLDYDADRKDATALGCRGVIPYVRIDAQGREPVVLLGVVPDEVYRREIERAVKP